jgi:hypothetical protein
LRAADDWRGAATLSELQEFVDDIPYPGLPKRNPGLKLANAFSVKIKTFSVRSNGTIVEVGPKPISRRTK